ncbi:uncharacterized protein LOC125037743 [Penaeus chinensis]|uniref:uncharacterized protein LOC125037743 n=1 Tax=Penaeus chinensis TaxID=139456 RepID=UPI001FB58683|nr:uncharacterized protein LOC125037743 [Penaeus chinensis]
MSSRSQLRLQYIGVGTMLMGVLIMTSLFLFNDCRSKTCSREKNFVSVFSFLWIVSGASILLIAFLQPRRDIGQYRNIPSTQVNEGTIYPVPGSCQYQQGAKCQVEDPPPPYQGLETSPPPPYQGLETSPLPPYQGLETSPLPPYQGLETSPPPYGCSV